MSGAIGVCDRAELQEWRHTQLCCPAGRRSDGVNNGLPADVERCVCEHRRAAKSPDLAQKAVKQLLTNPRPLRALCCE